MALRTAEESFMISVSGPPSANSSVKKHPFLFTVGLLRF